MVPVFPYLGIHVSANDENVVFRDATHKRGQLIFTNFGRAVTGDKCCTQVAIKSSYPHSWVYFHYLVIFRACDPICIPTPPIVALKEFSHADVVANVHPLPVS